MAINAKKDSLFDVISGIMLYVYLGVTLLLVLGALFGGGGIESQTNQTVFIYAEIIGLIGITLIFMLKFGQYLVQNSHNYKKIGWIGSVIHDPELSGFPIQKKGFFWLKNPLYLALVSLIPTSILGLIQVYQNTFFNAIPERVSQQIQESSQALLSIFPSELEIFLPCAFAGLALAINQWALNSKRIEKGTYYLIRFVVVPAVFVLSWIFYHLWRYQNSSISIEYVIIFAVISAYLLVTFMSLIPVLIFKITNNLYQFLNGAIQSNETVLLITVALNFIVIALFFYLWSTRKSKASQ
jgi:hypothetical protein